MKYLLALIVFLGSPVIGSTDVVRNAHDIVSNDSSLGSALTAYNTQCPSEVEVLSTLQKLSSDQSQSESNQARDWLLKESKRSSTCKTELTAQIMRVMNNAQVSFDNDPKNLSLWREGANLLAELTSSEVIDFLISHLDITTGLHSRSLRHQPAANAVIKIGSAAVPKLAVALRHNSNREIRMLVAYCLTSIGLETPGRASLTALQQAVASESDQCISNFIS
ncbi:MAG TPA: hypothetical protein VF435_00505, partial [Pyrinomonadaceae bacterium]